MNGQGKSLKGKMVETIKVDMTVDRIKSKSKEDRAFALKLNNYFCPMTPIFLGSYNVSKSYMRQVIGFYRPDFRFEAANDITLVLKLA